MIIRQRLYNDWISSAEVRKPNVLIDYLIGTRNTVDKLLQGFSKYSSLSYVHRCTHCHASQ